ncbi:hypothetical protein ACM55H_17540 [Flavobacterium sp. ZT3R17]|uniref:hypothetical protein n=1 Tax=Flavobacterium cryoconiti TaxID=3398736 RepID=UPI003A88E503
MENTKKKAWNNSLIISLVYVGIGTLSVLCSYPPYYGDWVLFGLFITFPVSIFSFGIMIAGKYYLAVIAIQIIIFFIFWYLCYHFLLKKYLKKTSD